MMTPGLVAVSYIAAAVLFILALGGLSNPETARRGNMYGIVGMALSGRDTGGSQFFITLQPAPHLDGGYTAFGRVASGMDVVDQLSRGDVIRHVRVWNGGTE